MDHPTLSAADEPAVATAAPEVPAAAEATPEAVAPEIVEPEAIVTEAAVTDVDPEPLEAPAIVDVAPEPVALAEPAVTDVAAEAAEVAPVAEGELPAPPAAPAKKPVDEQRRLRAQQAWDRVVAAKDANEVLTGTVTVVVKGGLLVDVGGIRGFLPASQVRVAPGTALDTLVRTKVPLRVIDIDQDRRRIVVSHRRAVEDERRAKRAEILKSLAVGQIREGVVARIADFGAFIDLGGIDGLVPVRELAFERVEKPSDVVQIGETIQVEVLRIEENGKKISLSRKNALPDPLRDHAALLKTGTTIEGTVVAKEPSLRVEIAPGLVGAVRESDANPADYEIGEKLEVVVRFVDRRTRRISLTLPHIQQESTPQHQTTYQTSSGFAPLGVELSTRGRR
jgi:ribosomal protein S1